VSIMRTYIQKYFLNCCVGGSIDTLAYTLLNKKYGVTANESDSTVSELQRHLHSPSRRKRHKLYLGSSTFLLGSTVRTTQVRTVNQQGVSTQLYFVPPPREAASSHALHASKGTSTEVARNKNKQLAIANGSPHTYSYLYLFFCGQAVNLADPIEENHALGRSVLREFTSQENDCCNLIPTTVLTVSSYSIPYLVSIVLRYHCSHFRFAELAGHANYNSHPSTAAPDRRLSDRAADRAAVSEFEDSEL